jgi:2-polyprenyl-3-methyl-5-hydroxy-6-metoxy-1,4-benzoquinol methylase
MTGSPLGIVADATCGFRHLEPVPAEAELEVYYRERYYQAIVQEGRAPELGRIMRADEEAEREKRWLRATLHADIAALLGGVIPAGRVLDVGCGNGELLSSLFLAGFQVSGLEPSAEAAAQARARGLRVSACTLEQAAREPGDDGHDAAVLVNVLEHVPDPRKVLGQVRGLLRPGGYVCLRVPNDFNALQAAAQAELATGPWWVAVPDHVNYFDFESLGRLLQETGYREVRRTTDFPMELFLLMGENYLQDRGLGARLHARRVRLELALPVELRRKLYATLAGIGLGRNCLVLARREDD